MARRLRVQFPGALYHLMNRGDRREAIFVDDDDRRRFLETLGDVCAKADWRIHAYCLMGNHFHLVVETPAGNLVEGMKWLLGTYTVRFNRRHKLSGHLFAGRYKAQVIDGQNRGYLKTACDYVHLNPVRAGLIDPNQPLRAYPWSSFAEYLKPLDKRINWLRVDRVLGEWSIPKDSDAGRRQFEQRMERRRKEDLDEAFHPVRSQWYLGDEQFRAELLAQMNEKLGPYHYGAEVQQSSEEKARAIIAQELRRLKWSAADLPLKAKGDPAKLKIAQRLRAETTMTLKWVADHLKMGTKTHLAHLLYWDSRKNEKPLIDTLTDPRADY